MFWQILEAGKGVTPERGVPPVEKCCCGLSGVQFGSKNDAVARVLALAVATGAVFAKTRAKRSFFERAGSHRSTLREPARLKNDALARVLAKNVVKSASLAVWSVVWSGV